MTRDRLEKQVFANLSLKKRIAEFEADMIKAAQTAVDNLAHANKRVRAA